MNRTLLFAFLLVTFSLAACRKEVEIQLKEVDKTYSWTEIKRLYGTEKIILNTGKDANSIYLQTPSLLGILSPLKNPPVKNSFGYYISAFASLPSDVSLEIPIGPTFLAYPVQDTLLQLIRTTEPTTSNYNDFINLRQLDPRAASIIRTNTSWLPFGAINRNNTLLFGYRTSTYTDLRFVLAKVSIATGGQLQTQSRTIVISAPAGRSYSSIKWIVAIDNYFIVQCDGGLYKILEDGTAKRVFGSNQTDDCYKWQGVLYAVEEYNSMLLSKDDGETWQRATGTPDAFNFTSYHVVGDSLVGVTHGAGDNQIFTLRWKGNTYSIRALKNDGLGQVSISGLEQLGDTVYVGTTSGLFKRPLSTFFETKL